MWAKLISGEFIEDNHLYVTMITSNVPYITMIAIGIAGIAGIMILTKV